MFGCVAIGTACPPAYTPSHMRVKSSVGSTRYYIRDGVMLNGDHFFAWEDQTEKQAPPAPFFFARDTLLRADIESVVITVRERRERKRKYEQKD